MKRRSMIIAAEQKLSKVMRDLDPTFKTDTKLLDELRAARKILVDILVNVDYQHSGELPRVGQEG